MTGLISRRSFVAALALSPALIPLVSTVRAQETSPFAGLGLPELDLTVTATAIQGMPATLEAGRYLVKVTVSDELVEAGGGVVFVKPAGNSSDPYLPLVTLSAPPLPEDEYDAHYYGAAYAGGIHTGVGESAEIVIDLAPGNWIVAGGFQHSQAPVQFTVTGEMPTNLPEPESTATITMAEYSVEIAEGQLVAGSQVIKVKNAGAEIHHLVVARSTVPITSADMEAVLQADTTGTPAAVSFNPDEDLIYTFVVNEMSPVSTLWHVADLAPGPHVFACYVFTRIEELPHAIHGMYLITEVSG
jgi:hypothetical protein